MLGPKCFRHALQFVRLTFLDRLNSSAQQSLAKDIVCTALGLRTAFLIESLTLSKADEERLLTFFREVKGFHNLDILTIGEDSTYIIHRKQLLNDINVFLSNDPRGFRRLFVNVDHRLEKPEIIPGNDCPPLREYIQNVLKPEIQQRVDNYHPDATYQRNTLPEPENLCIVTCSEWLGGYPVIYIIPKASTSKTQDQGDDDDSDECGRNCLANRELIISNIQLEPNPQIEGLKDHCLMSFSYPSELTEFCHSTDSETTECPLTFSANYSTYREPRDDDDEEDDIFVDASDVGFQSVPSSRKSSFSNLNSATTTATTTTTTATTTTTTATATASLTNTSSYSKAMEKLQETIEEFDVNNIPPSVMDDPFISPQPQSNSDSGAPTRGSRVQEAIRASVVGGEDLGRFKSKALPIPANEDIFTVGRSFLREIHNRFQSQTIWITWEIDQDNVTLPVVGLR